LDHEGLYLDLGLDRMYKFSEKHFSWLKGVYKNLEHAINVQKIGKRYERLVRYIIDKAIYAPQAWI